MKKLTFLGCLLLCLTMTMSAQRQTSSSMDDLLNRYSQLGDKTGNVSDYFTASERQMLNDHFNNQELPIPSPQVAELLDRLEAAGNSSLVEPLNLFNDYERGLLQEYYSNAYPSNGGMRAPGDVWVLNVRAACGQEFGTFPLGGPYTINPIVVNASGIFAGEFDDNGVLYGLNFDILSLVTIDQVTGAETTVGPLTNMTGTPSGLAWNEANGTMYAASTDGAISTIYTIDLTTGTCTVIGNTGNTLGIWLAIDPAGNAFMADIGDDNLYSIDLTTGAGTLVGPLGIDISFAQDADFDPDTGTLYMGAYIGGGVNFWASVDTTTGTATTLGTVNADCAEIGLAAIEGTPVTTGPSTAYAVENAAAMNGTFETDTPATFTPIAAAIPVGPDFEGAGAVDPYDPTTAYVAVNNGDFFSLDLASGVYTFVGNLGVVDFTGLEFSPDNGLLYGVTLTELYTINPSTATANLVGTTGMAVAIALAIDGDGNGYSYDITDDNFYSVDLSTGTATVVGPLGFDAAFGQGMAWDGNTDTIYMTAFNFVLFDSELRTVDPATGATTLIGQMEPGALTQYAWVVIPAPALENDACEDARPIFCGSTITGDTTTNTDQGGANASPDAWFSYTGSGTSELLTVSLCDGGTAYDSRLTVYNSCGGIVIATNDDFCGVQSELKFVSDGSTTYYIAVEGFDTPDAGAFSLAITCDVPLINDICQDALPISCGETVSGTTINATDDAYVAPDCGTATVTTPGVWYVYEDTTGLVTDITVSLCNGSTAFDTKLSVFTGDCNTPPLTCVDGNDDACGTGGLVSEVSFQSDGNSTYLILVHGFGGQTGDFDLDMTCIPVPPPNDDIANSIDVDEIGCPFTDPAVPMPAATTEGGNPTDCNIDGANGVWYNITPDADGEITATITTPAGASFVNFFTAPDENAVETDLVLVDWWNNQCGPATSTTIPVVAGQAYYIFVVNTGGITDIEITCDLLGIDDNTIEGFSYYPNPADETISLSAADTIEKVVVYNMLGQKMIDQAIDATISQVNVANLATGTYIMQVTVNGQVGSYHIIKK